MILLFGCYQIIHSAKKSPKFLAFWPFLFKGHKAKKVQKKYPIFPPDYDSYDFPQKMIKKKRIMKKKCYPEVEKKNLTKKNKKEVGFLKKITHNLFDCLSCCS